MEAIIQFLKNLGLVKLVAMITAVIIVFVSLILTTSKFSSTDLVPLYGGLDLKDSNEITTILEQEEIPFKIKAGGSEILVPQEQVLKLRMKLAAKGIPSQGSLIGYEIFDKNDTLGSSNFIQNVNLLRALEGELVRTITSLTNISSARVHLVLPKRELFARDKQLPSASVVIGTKTKGQIMKSEIEAISHLIATAVPNLEVNRITIIDNTGRPLKLGNRDDSDSNIMISKSEEFRLEYEKKLKFIIEDLLSQSLGIGHIKAEVSADINFDRTVTNSESFNPDQQVVRSVQEINDLETSTNKDFPQNVSVTTNLPNTNQPSSPTNQSDSKTQRSDTTTNYEISKVVTNQISEGGTIKKLSIAVLVDGTYNTDEKTKTTTYSARTPVELLKYENLVKSAVGFDPNRGDKIEVINMQFAAEDFAHEDTTIDRLKDELPSIIRTLVIGVVIVLILLLVIRPVAMRVFDIVKPETSSENQTLNELGLPTESTELPTGDALIDIAKIEARFQANTSQKSINEIFSKYPQETLFTLRKWLNKE